MNLLEELKDKTYKPSAYTSFYVYEPKIRKIEKARYIDRIVNRWLVDNFIKPVYVLKFVNESYACIEGRGMHKACLDLQKIYIQKKKVGIEIGNYSSQMFR